MSQNKKFADEASLGSRLGAYCWKSETKITTRLQQNNEVSNKYGKEDSLFDGNSILYQNNFYYNCDVSRYLMSCNTNLLLLFLFLLICTLDLSEDTGTGGNDYNSEKLAPKLLNFEVCPNFPK